MAQLDLDKLAHLSRLTLAPERKAQLEQDMEKILGFVAKIERMELEGVEPLVHLSDEVNVLRPDVVEQTFSHAEAMKNAPGADTDYFRVPRR
jgi:aspartyl-tRNA(Asn)/glutamyl-tRNA(Gln) amidotransferase subunit C